MSDEHFMFLKESLINATLGNVEIGSTLQHSKYQKHRRPACDKVTQNPF
jgi:hypothetical protein